ncbi:MAG TPA: alpha/beta fold hydrolase [Rhodocyclaceae bacterium]|nr:alpha/beta fold hydrolase [Rhodocyclaceae bacterium]
MSQPRLQDLEVLARLPTGRTKPAPLLFVHGAYTGAWCWDEHFLSFFAQAGYASYAVSLSGHGRSRGRERLDHLSISDYVADVAEVAAKLTAPPILIGHSMGGFVVQKYLERHGAAGAVLMCSVPPQGLMSAAFGVMFSHPGLFSDLNNLMAGGKVALDSLREALFAQPIGTDDLARFYRWSQPESHRAVWDMSLFDLPHPSRVAKVPLLVLGAEFDHLMPASTAEMTARSYGVEAEIFPGMGHGLMLERDWREVAQRLLDWLQEVA